MKFTMTKLVAGLALAAVAMGSQAATVTSMTLADVINTDTNGAAVGAPDGLGTDGRSGAFRFNVINGDTYSGSSFFSGDVNGGVINVSAANAPLAFTTGFDFAGSPFQPMTQGPIAADITDGTLTITSLPWAGYYVGADFVFNMPADAYTVRNLISLGGDEWAYRISFNHVITEQDDPSGQYVEFNANWMLEGVMSTAVATAPVPEASTYGMMLAGLGLVGFAVRRRKLMA